MLQWSQMLNTRYYLAFLDQQMSLIHLLQKRNPASFTFEWPLSRPGERRRPPAVPPPYVLVMHRLAMWTGSLHSIKRYFCSSQTVSTSWTWLYMPQSGIINYYNVCFTVYMNIGNPNTCGKPWWFKIRLINKEMNGLKSKTSLHTTNV